MQQKSIVGILVALVVVLAGTTIYFATQKNAYAPAPSQNTPTQSMAGQVSATANQTATQNQGITNNQNEPSSNLNPKIKLLDAKWNLYTNEQLGFSMKIPKKISVGIDPESNGNCPETEGVNVFEDGKYIYITPEYSTSSDEKINCAKTNLKILNVRWHTDKEEDYSPGGWLITTGEARNNQELEKFIKNEVGNDCLAVESKKESKEQTGVFDITVKNNPSGYCIMNFEYRLKYSPKTGKVVYINIGQDQSFPLSPYPDKPYAESNSADSDMISSLKMLGI